VNVNTAPHRERLSASAPWWLGVVLAGVTVGWLLLVAVAPPIAGAVTVVTAAALGLGLWRWGSATVVAAPGSFRAGDAVLTAPHLGAVEPIGPEQWRAALDRAGVDRAFLLTRPWIDRGVRVVVDDPDDPTPYWLVSSRHPDAVARAVGHTGDAHEGRNTDGTEEASGDERP